MSSRMALITNLRILGLLMVAIIVASILVAGPLARFLSEDLRYVPSLIGAGFISYLYTSWDIKKEKTKVHRGSRIRKGNSQGKTDANELRIIELSRRAEQSLASLIRIVLRSKKYRIVALTSRLAYWFL